MSKLSYDHPPKWVCILSADNVCMVDYAMYEQPSSSLVGTSPLRCWFLADEARRGAFSSGLLLLLVQAGGGGGGESGAHSYHRPVLLLLCSGALHHTLLRATIPAPNSGSPWTTLDHILARMTRVDNNSVTTPIGPCVKGLKPFIFVPPKSLYSFALFFVNTLRFLSETGIAGAIKEASEAWQTGRRC